MKLPIFKHILVFTTWCQKCPHSEPEQFTFDNFQSNHPVHQRPSNFCLMNASADASSPSAELNYAQFFPRLCLHMVQDMQANY